MLKLLGIFFKNCLTLIGGLLFALILCEIILRVFFPQELITKTGHPLLLSTHIPNFNGVIYNPYEKGLKTHVQFNSQGFRQLPGATRVIPYEKPPSTYRVFLLGDSFVESKQVEWQDSFSFKLDQLLHQEEKKSGKKFEVLSMGVGGWDQASELEYYKIEGSKFKPDLLAVCVFVGNDLAGNRISWKALKKVYESKRSQYFIHRNFLQKVKIYFGSHSHFYSLIRLSTQLNSLTATPNSLQKALIAMRQNFKNWQRKIKVVDVPETSLKTAYPRSRQWDVLEELFREFKKITADSGTELVIVVIPEKEANRGDSRRMGEIQGVIQVAEKAGLPYVDLFSAFERQGPVSDFFYKNDKHLNRKGHAATAQLLLDYVNAKQ